MAGRKNISKKTRFEIFKRDSFACQYCGRTPPAVMLQVDHVIPVAEDGPDDEGNLVTSCFDCNSGKGARMLGQAPIPIAARMKQAKEAQAQIEEYAAFLMEAREREQEEVNYLGRYWFNKTASKKDRDKYVFGPSSADSVKRFIKQLPLPEILDAMDITHGNADRIENVWSYFCGVCWKKIKDRQDGKGK